MAEYNASGTLLNRYIHGAGSDDPLVRYSGTGTANKRYLLSDERGSIVSETDASGNEVETHRYGPYGEPINQSASRFRYTGQILIPGTELYHYKARVYHPKLGRFMQTDPIGYEDGMNWYAYGGNDPVNMTDPSGLCGRFKGNRGCSEYKFDGDVSDLIEGNAQKQQNTRQNISNGLTGAGGVAQIAAGVAACSTGLGCVAGVPLIVLGVSNMGEAGTGFAAPDGKGFSLTGAAIERGFDALGTENSAGLAVKTNAVVNLTADLVGLNVPSLAKNGFKLFRHIPTDYVRAIDNATTTGLILQAGGTINTTVNALDTGSN